MKMNIKNAIIAANRACASYVKDYRKTSAKISKLRNALWEKHKPVCIALSAICAIIFIIVQVVTYKEVRKEACNRQNEKDLEESKDSIIPYDDDYDSDNE